MAFIGNSMRTTPNGFGGNGQSPLAPPRANVRQWTPEQLRERISSLPAPQFRQQTSWQSPISGRSGSGYVLPSSATTGPFASPFAQAGAAKPTGQTFPQPYRGTPGNAQAGPSPWNMPLAQAQQAHQQYLAQNQQQTMQAQQPLSFAGYSQVAPGGPGGTVNYGGFTLPGGMNAQQFAQTGLAGPQPGWNGITPGMAQAWADDSVPTWLPLRR